MYLASVYSLVGGIDAYGRRAICVERRKSSVMGRCQHAHIVSTTKTSASLLKLKRSATLPKGMGSTSTGDLVDADPVAVQNISRD